MASTNNNTSSSAATVDHKQGRPRKVVNTSFSNTQTTDRVSKRQVIMQMSEALAQKQKKIEELAKMMNTLTTKHKTLYEYTNRLTIKHKMLHEYARRQHLQLQRFRQLPGAKIVTTRAAAWNRGGNVVAMAQRVHVQPPTPGQ